MPLSYFRPATKRDFCFMFPEQLNNAAPLSRYLVTRVEETITPPLLLLSVLHEDHDIVDCG